MLKILFIEDDTNIAKGVLFNLTQAGFTPIWKKNVTEGLAQFNKEQFDLVLTDLGLPDGNGLDLCTKIRSGCSEIPILILTARTEEEHVLKGFESGVNDYIKKPFSNKELIARIKANLKEPLHNKTTVSIEGLTTEENNPVFTFSNKTFELRKSQHKILYYMMKNKDRLITRNSLLKILNIEDKSLDRTIDVHLSHLRKKLKSVGYTGFIIKSIYGLGYRLEVCPHD